MELDPARLLRRHEALASGMAPHEIRALHTSGGWQRIARGNYIGVDHLESLDAASRHRLLVLATAPSLSEHAVVSHDSAAVLHRLPQFRLEFSTVHVTRDRRGGGRTTRGVTRHCSEIGETVQVEGVRVTSIARTVVDIARTRSLDSAVVLGDAALRMGVGLDELTTELHRARGWKGVAAARRVVEHLDGRSESAGESLSRLRLIEHGFDEVELQVEVRDTSGKFIGRADFRPVPGVLGEFDGKVKYVKYLRPDQTVSDAVIAEKKREDELRDQGFQVVRWGWADLFAFDAIAERLRRAADRAAGAVDLRPASGAHRVVRRTTGG